MTAHACAACATLNEADARFCEGCGTALERTCGACGVAASPNARFCRACGTPLDGGPGPVAAAPTRKTVTVMFSDLAGSTAFEEVVDAETAREVIGRYHDLLRSTAERHRAGVVKYIGDGFMAVWGVPEIRADDAEHAVEAAIELQERFVGLAGRVAEVYGVNLALRVAVNTGEVVVGADDADLVGDALNVGSRLESECPHGHVVVGEETWRSTRGRHRYDPLGPIQVKGRSSPVAVYQWSGRSTEASDSVAFVGRADELRRIQAVFDDAVDNAAVRLITIIGDPGVGKSRLAAEFISAHSDVRIVRANCAVEGTPALTPIVELLRTRDIEADVPVATPERERIVRALTGMAAGVAGSVEETFWALRRFVEILAAERPLIIVFDDIHWADSLLLDFIEHLAEWARGVPVLMIALARPELRETRPDLVTVGGGVTGAVRLSGLEPRATAELAAQVLGSEQLPLDLLGRLPSSTGGNPLFVRELVGMLVHDGVLVPRPDGWRLTVDVDAIAIPPTIQALLASRLERLNAADRRVLEVASVVGSDFSPTAVCALTGLGRTETKAALDRLRRHDLAQPTGTYSGDEPVWRFHHVLIRDVAYRRLLKSDRAELHERLAEWVTGDGARPALHADEMVARHLEAAVGYQRDLGMRDEHTAELALRSARSYLASARRALDRDELLSAGTQAARGAAIAAGDPSVQAELLLIGCEAYLSAGDVAAGAPLVDEIERVAGESLAPWAICYRSQLIAYTDPTRLLEVDERLQGAIDEFSRRKDSGGLAKAHRVRANARARLGRVGDCEIDLFDALIAARQGGDHRQITAALGAAPNAALWGPSPAPKAGGRCLDVVRMQRMTTAAPSLEATSLRCLAVLELLRGRADKARTMLADARQVVADLGLRHGLMETELFAGIIEMMVGDPVSAEPHFRTAMEGLDALGVGADAGQAAALLARSVLAQGRIDEADRYAAQSERIAGHNLKTAIAWRAVRGEILSAQGEHAAAIAKAQEAVAVAAETDLVLDHADACLALSRVLVAAGEAAAAARARGDAESLYAAKDAVFMVGRAEHEVAVVTPPTPTQLARGSGLVVRNRASDLAEAGWRGIQNHDIEAVAAVYSNQSCYDDRRPIGGGPLAGLDWVRKVAERVIADYPHAEWQTLAVRGDALVLIRGRLWDDAANESVTLNVHELAADGLIGYHGRFDGDDFEGAYREMEKRYYAGEGAAFAENGRGMCAFIEAMWRRDAAAARRISWPDFRWLASPSALKPEERSVDEFFDWLRQRTRQLSAMPMWVGAVHWISPNCCVALAEIQGTGAEGEQYDWSRIYAAEYRDGLAASVREFDVDDEDAAFAYAESLVAPRQRRLVVANAASQAVDRAIAGLRANDAVAVNSLFSPNIIYEDRRPVAGALVTGIDYLSETVIALLAQYDHFAGHTLAVRGDRHCLAWSRWSDDTGNESSNLHVIELGDDGLIAKYLYCADDDFEDAYQEMEAWYYAGEGRLYADHGRTQSAFVEAMNHLDSEAIRRLCRPEFRWLSLPWTLTLPARTVDELIDWWRERVEQAGSVRQWNSAVTWLSPDVWVGLGDAYGISTDGAEYTWAGIYVGTFVDGLVESVCEFEDEDAAFAYAESLVAPKQRRLVIANAASRALDQAFAALQANDPGAVATLFSAAIVYEDRRPLAGALQTGVDYLNEVIPALLSQYDHFELHILAVRGDRLCLAWSRWSDPAGNEATNLHVTELGEDGLISRLVYFVGDDFWSAYQELEDRYYVGEGAPYAQNGRAACALTNAMNQLDAEAARQLCRPEFRWLSTIPSLVEPVRSIDEVVIWWRQRAEQVASIQNWTSGIVWLSGDVAVSRGEARGITSDGAEYAWSNLYVSTARHGLVESICAFELDGEDAAFAYAESLLRQSENRLVVSNAATQVVRAVLEAMCAHDKHAVRVFFSDDLVYEDRRPVSGVLTSGIDYPNESLGILLDQYDHFEGEALAVRGDRICILRTRWSDEMGNAATNLALAELGEDGLVASVIYFEEDDFWAAYREMENRYYASQGSAYAKNGLAAADWVIAISNGDIDGTRRASHPDFRWYATPSALKDAERTVDDMYRWWQERGRQVSAQRHWVPAVVWLSPDCAVAHGEIAAVGPDGEHYNWKLTFVTECRDGLVLAVREFDDEDSAFGYAESVAATKPSRLSLINSPSRVAHRVVAALRAGDLDTVVEAYADNYVHADHRRLSGEPLSDRAGIRDAWERIIGLYNRFEIEIIAARGERLHLARYQWSDDSGNQSVALILNETDDSNRIAFQDRFDEDDFAAAYAELDRRYYSGEGAAFAKEGVPLAEILHAENRGDLESTFKVFAKPGLKVESRSGSVFPNRTAVELRHSIEELGAMVTSYRVWSPSFCWLAENWVVGRHEREAVGPNGEKFTWTRLYVIEARGGLIASICEFDVEDEDAAFAYAEGLAARPPSRLSLSNSASRVADQGFAAMRADDAETGIGLRSRGLIYDDRRQIAGGLVGGIDHLSAGLAMLVAQYRHFEHRTLAVRGERLWLGWSRCSDDAGNEADHLHLIELGADGLIAYEARFDEDDFEAAYAELERRYFAGEGALCAAAGAALTGLVLAESRGDLNSAFTMLSAPGLRIENRSRSFFPSRSADELRRSVEELGTMVESYRVWGPSACWLSDEWMVGRHAREAVGSDGEKYEWNRIYVARLQNGLFTHLCEFEVDDEDAAFAYAEEQMRLATSRLPLVNRATSVGQRFIAALHRADLDAAAAVYSDQVVYDDRRHLSGNPIRGASAVRSAIERFAKHYNRFELTTIAIRGERLQLSHHRWSDDAGNQATGFILAEIDDDELVTYDGRFDEDDFDSAYRELENRYYAGEGAEFANNGLIMTKFLELADALDVDAARPLCAPSFTLITPPTSLTPQERSLSEFFQWQRQRSSQVSSVKYCLSAIRWLSPTCLIALADVLARGTDDEKYAWARIYVAEFNDGLLASIRQFDDEESAFAYAEERMRATASRLVVSNRASEAAQQVNSALRAGDVGRLLSCCSEDYVIDDRRRFAGDLLRGHESLRAGIERVLDDFNAFEMHTLAVRGERLALCLSRWSDDSRNESTHLHAFEVGEDGRILDETRFDEDDFDSAYRELENRYYAGEGAAFAEPGTMLTDYLTTKNRGDLDTLFDDLSAPDVHIESRSFSVFLDRSAAEYRASLEELDELVGSVREWLVVVEWLSPRWCVALLQREAVGDQGEQYAWTRVVVIELRGGRFASACQFEPEDEAAAFSYARERVRESARPLAVTNAASRSVDSGLRALRSRDIDAFLEFYSDGFVFEDRRRLSGAAIRDKTALRSNIEVILAQYDTFEWRTLAVRGDTMALWLNRWSDKAGNESQSLHLVEVDGGGLAVFHCIFDEDDFDGAYRELEARYYNGEGTSFAEYGGFNTDYMAIMNRGDFDTMFNELSWPDLRFENHARSVFPDRSAGKLRANFEDLYAMLASVRSWFSALRWVSPTLYAGRLEREGVGHDGEQYAWTRILVNHIRDGRLAAIYEFDEDDDAAALAYAEELLRQT